MSAQTLEQLQFDNRFTAQLPADPESENFRRQVVQACYSHVLPTRVSQPKLLAYSSDVAGLLDLSPESCRSELFTQVFSGNQQLPGMQPYACCYGGHQFGHWAGQLGDGRAINLGEIVNQGGEHWTLQLKGAGPTPYSRTADGLAVLRSSIREFLCSEAMHHLGVPTTRALSLVLTGEQVKRDMFYDGNAEFEPGAVVCRVAPSFTRFGNFEIFAARGDVQTLKQLLDFTIRTDFTHLLSDEKTEPDRETYIAWFETVCHSTAQMIAHWMRVGFVHGVMNTDNMSVLGLTIDYGPYGWLEGFDPDWTPNTTDAQGKRYRFGLQPKIALWNLAALGNALFPLINDATPLHAALDGFRRDYEQQSRSDMSAKLGLSEFQFHDQALFDELNTALQCVETDMTIFYRCLADFDARPDNAQDDRSDAELMTPVMMAYYQTPDEEQGKIIGKWLRAYRNRLLEDGRTQAERRACMNAINPKYVLRNYLAQQAIDKATAGDYAEINHLLTLLRQPYEEQPAEQAYFAKRPEWARHKAGCSMLSCSS